MTPPTHCGFRANVCLCSSEHSASPPPQFTKSQSASENKHALPYEEQKKEDKQHAQTAIDSTITWPSLRGAYKRNF